MVAINHCIIHTAFIGTITSRSDVNFGTFIKVNIEPGSVLEWTKSNGVLEYNLHGYTTVRMFHNTFPWLFYK